ncbi:hypothetical protein C7271_06745 [filamentous cyanobacterium CCP5]|nr:hypothetical protein C7271_06745 [filamentous cyanobacterium CCP5]
MKRSLGISLATLAAIAVVPFVQSAPGWAHLQKISSAIAEQIQRPEVKLVLEAHKQIETVDNKGETQVTWQLLEGEATVQPQDRLRYTITSENAGEQPAQNLVITQPIPAQMTYVLDTAIGNGGTSITYSIDGGQSFVAEPLVEVVQPDGSVVMEPAPAEDYTHIRWDFSASLEPEVAVQVAYDLSVN